MSCVVDRVGCWRLLYGVRFSSAQETFHYASIYLRNSALSICPLLWHCIYRGLRRSTTRSIGSDTCPSPFFCKVLFAPESVQTRCNCITLLTSGMSFHFRKNRDRYVRICRTESDYFFIYSPVHAEPPSIGRQFRASLLKATNDRLLRIPRRII